MSTSSPWPRSAVSIMVFRENTVLLGRRNKPPYTGIWSLPGGHIEPGETVHQAALRELREETGTTAKITGYAGTRDIITNDDDGKLTAHYVLTVLTGRWLGGTPVASTDCSATEWVPVSGLAGYDMTDGTQAMIEQVYQNSLNGAG
ncbi:MAG: NUDIX hydrolase, partial [Hyphomicrobiaceae bacterium]